MPATTPELVVVGRVGAPYGVKGWVRVTSFTDPPDNLLGYAPWHIAAHEGARWHPRHPLKLKPHGTQFIALFPDVVDRDGAERMSRSVVGVARTSLPVPAEGEFYWRDLVGKSVETDAGEPLGRITRMLDTPAHDVMVVAGADRERLIPFAVPVLIAVEDDRVVVDWDPQWE